VRGTRCTVQEKRFPPRRASPDRSVRGWGWVKIKNRRKGEREKRRQKIKIVKKTRRPADRY